VRRAFLPHLVELVTNKDSGFSKDLMGVSRGLIKVCHDRFSWLMICRDGWCLRSCGRCAQPLIPGFDPRPQGAGTAPVDEIERTIAWLFGYHRLSIRYERYDTHFCAFLTIAAALTRYKKLRKATT
jgi:hypothetical protein